MGRREYDREKNGLSRVSAHSYKYLEKRKTKNFVVSASADHWKDRKSGGMNMQPAASVWPSLLALVILVRARLEKIKRV